MIKKIFSLILVLLISFLPQLVEAKPTSAPPPPPESISRSPDLDQARGSIESAVQMELAASKGGYPALGMYQLAIDHIEMADDDQNALVHLAMLDPQTGDVLASEPILALAQRSKIYGDVHSAGSGWQITLQFDSDFVQTAVNLPAELRSSPGVEEILDPPPLPKAVDATTYGGYLLPWAKGVEKRLTMGANHVSCPATCRYAFDFSDGTMFPLLAAKGGTVYQFYDGCPNGSTSCTNSLTLEDRSTVPYTYQIYFHLAQGSIPSNLKAIGTLVQQGMYIGNVDDTGYSSGHHLHFMVVTNPFFGSSGLYWGYSVDITFRDVATNWDAATQGGRPCTANDVYLGYCAQSQLWYVSGNQGSNPPTGGLSAPAHATVITTPTVAVSGWGSDDLAVTRLQVLANYNGSWQEVGPSQTVTPFTANVDLCSAGIPNGPVTLALRVWDYEGNQSISPLEARAIEHRYPCASAPPPPPACSPGSSQVAIYAEPNYEGACKVFGVGNYASGSSLGVVGGNNAASIKVGSNVSASLFWDDGFTKRSETFTGSPGTGQVLWDSNLSDNLTGANTLSSLEVESRISATPSSPSLYPVTNQLGVNPTSVDSLVLSWRNTGGATKFQAELYNGAVQGTPYRSLGFSTDQFWSVGSLPAGNYTWRVQGRIVDANGDPYYSDWASASFTVANGSLQQTAPVGVPYLATMEGGTTGWVASGLWRQTSLPAPGGETTTAWIFNNGTDYADSSVRAGDLTSPPISLPASPASYLRFTYRSQTESDLPFFDQRRVQISVDQGAFVDLISTPLNGDEMQTWLGSPAISLAAYSGRQVRIRFHFDITDPYLNNLGGWAIDNVEVSTTPPPACTESPSNDAPASAITIAYGVETGGVICPAGDVDYFKFTASSGDHIQAWVNAQQLAPPSLLDPILTLLDNDGHSVLAENDDIDPGVKTDSRLSFSIKTNGVYYLKVKAWNHPGAGGTDYRYTLNVNEFVDVIPPQLTLIQPSAPYVPAGPVTLSASATDETGGSGVRQVDFYWHGPDWTSGNWTLLASDTNGSDGWTAPFDTAIPDGSFYALFVRATDWAGNTSPFVLWNVTVDRTAPATALAALPASLSSTAVPLQWSGSDTPSGIASFQVQFQVDGGAWQDYPTSFSGTQPQGWFIGEVGHQYAFRLRGIDRAGNVESYPATAEASTTITGCGGDAYELADDSQPGAVMVSTDSTTHGRNVCGSADPDWIWFNAVAGQRYMIRVQAEPGSGAAPAASLHQADGTPLGIEGSITQPGGSLILGYSAQVSGPMYVRISSGNPAIYGDLVAYSVYAGQGTWIHMPVIYR